MASPEQSLSDPASDTVWEVWYLDTFDRESPSQCEVSGRGLVRGLVELWARHLFETVRRSGGMGFSQFYLRCGRSRIDINGPWEGAVRLRNWVFGSKEHGWKGYVAEGDAGLLERIAVAHAVLHLAGRTSEPILAAAIASADRQEFECKLPGLGIPVDPTVLFARTATPKVEALRQPDENEEDTDCLECGETIPAGADKCPSCGWSYLSSSDTGAGAAD